MYKDKNKQKEANRLAKQKQRGMTKGMTSEGMTQQGMTYPTIIVALVDPEKRAKLTSICNQLKDRGLLDKVSYGLSDKIRCPTFREVDKMLSALK